MLSVIFSHPFTWGLCIGLILLIWVWISGLIKRFALKKQIKELDLKVRTLTETISSSASTQSKTIDEMKEQIAKQKVTIQLLQEKPNKTQERELRMYAHAYVMMLERAPGFAQAWQNCVREIEEKEQEEQKGLLIFRKPLQNLIALLTKKPLLNTPEQKQEDQNIK